MKITRALAVGGLAMMTAACGREPEAAAPPAAPAEAPADAKPNAAEVEARADRLDTFTYANVEEIRVSHVDLDLTVDFEAKSLVGAAILTLNYVDAGARRLLLDTNDLAVAGVEARVNDVWEDVEFLVGPDDPVMGSKLTVELPDGADQVLINYSTAPGAAGLQWLDPAQTAGGETPFVYSQAQPILARSMAPLQDTPAIRITYTARLRTPPNLMAVMAAAQDPDGVRDGDYRFEMPQPVPSYLLALAVGDIEFMPISETIGVYAEEYIVEAAAEEFADAPAMEDAAAEIYGPYRWDRYDMIVMPPSFPFGGMENPRLTFLTPTLVAGDKSLTNVVAHEIAHSWSGNLVTNATWRDAWLNEGFTSYVENRIMERLYGEDRAVMERTLDLQALRADLENIERPELTQLKLPADLSNLDDAFSQVAYIKGAFFLKFLEERYGRAEFDAFLSDYFDAFAFKAVITEDFLDYLDGTLRAARPGVVTNEEIAAWVYGPGLPATIETPHSDRFDLVDAQQAAWLAGGAIGDAKVDAWTTHEWLHFIRTLPGDATPEQFAALDQAFSLSGHKNAEIAFAWYMQAIAAGYEPAFEPLDAFLMRVGRGKFIYPLYTALDAHGRSEWAHDVYARARPGYHPIAQRRIDAILDMPTQDPAE